MGGPWLRRARPLLGTLVEVGVPEGRDDALAVAFEVIEQVQRLMSIHDAKSDLSRLHAAPAGTLVDVHPWTGEVLQLAAGLSMQTGGLFDVARGSGTWSCQGTNGHASVVRHDVACRLDLGGIAKGWAVDRAVEALIELGVEALWVNAGGDLRSVGVALPIALRDEVDGGVRPWLQLSDGAMATSWFGEGARDSLHGQRKAVHVSVAAPRCVWADALTKVVAQTGDADEAWLRQLAARYEARIWVHGPARPGLVTCCTSVSR
ncbi:MAG: FAD:protein FMN transferase [Aquabacterium sp.]